MDRVVVTTEENDAFVWMQGRLVDLLLRNFEGHFHRLFDEQTGSLATLSHPALQTYNRMAVLFYLREELFEEILPLIKRKLSFAAPQVRQVEELPARGRIDWVRTAAANWNTFPDEPPTQVHTNQRNRHFATPENLLTVCTLLEYQGQTQDLLDRLSLGDASAKLRHPLNEIIDRCRRELGFLQFAELVPQANRTLDGYTDRTVEDLEEAVEANLLDNYNQAYARLLEWRSRLRRLRLLDRENTRQDTFMLGADPARDNYLYQIWLFYEMGDFLQRRGCLITTNYSQMELSYRWGEPGQTVEYRLQHDKSIAGAPTYWQSAPGVRPDFYIHRLNPQTVKDGKGELIWRLPGYVLDAKYYKPRGTVKAPSSPVKRMIADLQLTGERYGALLFAFQEGQLQNNLLPGDQEEETGETLKKSLETDNGSLYRIHPQADRAQYVQPDLEINLWRLRPKVGASKELDAVLETIFEAAHNKLQETVEIKCRAVFLDRLTSNAHGQMTQIADLTRRDGRVWSATSLDDLVLCPKPHIAPWRVDVVSVTNDCCKNHRLCHILSNPVPNEISNPPKRLVALQDIQKAIKAASNTGKDDDEIARLATEQVTVIVERYRDLIKPDLSVFDKWLKAEVGAVFFTSPLLTDKQRDTIRLACFLHKQISDIKAENYAGPALLFSGVLEEMIRITVFQLNSLKFIQPQFKTLGGVITKQNDVMYDVNSQGLWKDNINEYTTYKLINWINDLYHVKNIRNDAAHQAYLEETDYDELLIRLVGSKSTRPFGVFNGLLSAWKHNP